MSLEFEWSPDQVYKLAITARPVLGIGFIECDYCIMNHRIETRWSLLIGFVLITWITNKSNLP